jgi:hypothetical protein
LKILNAVLLSAVLLLGIGSALAIGQDHPYDNHDGNNNSRNAEYQKGFQDGINSARADINAHKSPDIERHPYYRNSHNDVYRDGFTKGYRETYDRGHHDHDHDNH